MENEQESPTAYCVEIHYVSGEYEAWDDAVTRPESIGQGQFIAFHRATGAVVAIAVHAIKEFYFCQIH